VHDGITLEKAGLPTAVICTEPFIPSARAMAKIQGIPDYPYIILPHPLGSLSAGELRTHAMRAAPEVLSVLLGKG
jgi:hypothetical protein